MQVQTETDVLYADLMLQVAVVRAGGDPEPLLDMVRELDQRLRRGERLPKAWRAPVLEWPEGS